MARRRLNLSEPREIRRTLNRIANLLYNGELGQKTAHTLAYICRTALYTFDHVDTVEEDDFRMKSDKQSTIQQLLRAAEITGDSKRRERYLDKADVLLQQELSTEALEAAEKLGLLRQNDN